MEALFLIVRGKGLWLSVGLLVLFLSWESMVPFFGFFQHKLTKRTIHGVRNLLLGALNAVLISLVFVAAWLWVAEFAYQKQFGLLYWIGPPEWVHAFGAIALFDFWTYWWHRMNHEIPFLWRFHRVHHSDPLMDVTTANRFHIGEIFFSSLFRIPLILLFGAQLWHLAVYELLLFPVVQFHHANIGLPNGLDRILRCLIVTPAMHKVHHSDFPTETNSNYTSLFSLWDRLFGSFRLRANVHSVHFGLEGYDQADRQTLVGLLKTPVDD